MEVEAERVPEDTEQKRWNEDEPKAYEAMNQVLLPCPGVLLEGAKNAAANEKSAEDEEDDDGLTPGRRYEIGDEEECVPGWQLVILNEEYVAEVVEADDEGREAAHGIERDRRL